MENKLQNLKFRVYSEQHSKAIQEALFGLNKNVRWNNGEKGIKKGITRIFLKEDYCLTYVLDNDEQFFNEHENTLCTLDDLYKMQAEPNPQSELMTKLESLQKELDKVKEEISKLNK